MADTSEVIGFPAFIANKKDPLQIFSDGAFHRQCVDRHPLAGALTRRYEAWLASNRPAARICRASGTLITDPDDYIGLGFLVESPVHELYPFNWAHFSRRALQEWPQRDYLLAAIERLATSSEWEGESLRWLIEDLASTK
jgi:hypothetical protein